MKQNTSNPSIGQTEILRVKDLTPLLKPKRVAGVNTSEEVGVGSLVIENLHILGCVGSFISFDPWCESILGNLA
jgi:hypothetical protein